VGAGAGGGVAVTTGGGGGTVAVVGVSAVCGALTGLPQVVQNFTPSGRTAPHSVQKFVIWFMIILFKNLFCLMEREPLFERDPL
jgi:hypothetical protein